MFDCSEGFNSMESFGDYSPRSKFEAVYKNFDNTFAKKSARFYSIKNIQLFSYVNISYLIIDRSKDSHMAYQK